MKPSLNKKNWQTAMAGALWSTSSPKLTSPTHGYPATVACGPKATAQTDIIIIFIYIQGKLGSPPAHPHPPKHFRAFLDF